MRIVWDNRNKIDEFRFHDSVFEGFHYDYEKRMIQMNCNNYFWKKMYNLRFNNVLFYEVQSCCFWSESNDIAAIYVNEDFSKLKELQHIQKAHQESYRDSYLDRKIQYMQVEMLVHSGDEVLIICESVDCIENNMDEETLSLWKKRVNSILEQMNN